MPSLLPFFIPSALLRQLGPPGVLGRLLAPVTARLFGIGAMQGLAATPQNLALCAFLIGWGGVSVHCQTAAVLAGTTLKSARHTAGRFLHGVFSVILILIFT